MIAYARRASADNGERICATPAHFNGAWWPIEEPGAVQFVEQVLSSYGQPSGPPEITAEYDAEVKVIRECLEFVGARMPGSNADAPGSLSDR